MHHLIEAYQTYTAQVAAFEAEHPFDLLTILDRPASPRQSPEARAGELLVTHGIAGAMRQILLMAADRPLTEDEQQVAQLLAIASVEG